MTRLTIRYWVSKLRGTWLDLPSGTYVFWHGLARRTGPYEGLTYGRGKDVGVSIWHTGARSPRIRALTPIVFEGDPLDPFDPVAIARREELLAEQSALAGRRTD